MGCYFGIFCVCVIFSMAVGNQTTPLPPLSAKPMDQLPDEILEHIFTFIPYKTVGTKDLLTIQTIQGLINGNFFDDPENYKNTWLSVKLTCKRFYDCARSVLRKKREEFICSIILPDFKKMLHEAYMSLGSFIADQYDNTFPWNFEFPYLEFEYDLAVPPLRRRLIRNATENQWMEIDRFFLTTFRSTAVLPLMYTIAMNSLQYDNIELSDVLKIPMVIPLKALAALNTLFITRFKSVIVDKTFPELLEFLHGLDFEGVYSKGKEERFHYSRCRPEKRMKREPENLERERRLFQRSRRQKHDARRVRHFW